MDSGKGHFASNGLSAELISFKEELMAVIGRFKTGGLLCVFLTNGMPMAL
jgi:hypothetical protein